MRSIFLQMIAVTTINLKSLPQRLFLSLATVIAVGLVVTVLLAFLAMANGFRRTIADSGAHHPTAIVTGKFVGQNLAHGSPVAGREVRLEALGHLACRVFQSRCLRVQFFELRERGVEVCLVENFAAAE